MSLGPPVVATARSPLEQFVRDYVEATGGVWDEIEPQVYDVMVPAGADRGADEEPALLRLAFDPEALPEHPHSQLASFGTPLVDQLLQNALQRGRCVELYLLGLNLQPHQLASRLARAVTLVDTEANGHRTPASAGETLTLEIERVRPLLFPQIVFWFEATFVSDQKEQELLPLAVDLHYGRQVRHLDQLLDAARLSERLSPPLPEVPGLSRVAAYRLAREQIVRTVTALANTRARELAERLERQAGRVSKYYADLADELDEQRQRAAARGDEDAKFAGRRETLERERELRIAELRQKNALSVQLRLLNLLVIRQPKLLVRAAAVAASGASVPLELVFDPLTETVEAPPCPSCGRPTFALQRRRATLGCAACVPASTPLRKIKPR